MAPDGYDSHADYMEWARERARKRETAIRDEIRDAFSRWIEVREVEVVNFGAMSVEALAQALLEHPSILKPISACCNVAGRSIERDLGIRNLNTYTPRLNENTAYAIAGYLKPFLPREIAIPALSELDRFFFVDKTVRSTKGGWEKAVVQAVNKIAGVPFRKRKFKVHDQVFELDGAAPETGRIEVGIDVKRIEARRDIHKRIDEIMNKAVKFKTVYPEGRFAAVLYYPFSDDHSNIRDRLQSTDIDAIVFASGSKAQIQTSVGLLIDKIGIRRKDRPGDGVLLRG